MPDDAITANLYERDLCAWAVDQAAALRAARGALLNADGHPVELRQAVQALDWDNLAEEIEGLARKDRRELGSRMALIVEHLTKLEFSPAVGPRAGWIDTVTRERDEVEEVLSDSPSLRRDVADLLTRRAASAIERAASALARHGETAVAAKARLARLGRGYIPDEVLGSWLPDPPLP